MRRIHRALVLCLTLMATACATASTTRSVNRSGGNEITQEEILRSSAASAYDLVRSLRPAWLYSRGVRNVQDPRGDVVQVYVNKARMGGPQMLGQIPASEVESIRFYDAAAANYRFGTGHMRGAIEVITKSGF